MSWEFADDVPEECQEFLDHRFEEWNDQDWFTTVQGMIEDEFDISQKEIDDITEEN